MKKIFLLTILMIVSVVLCCLVLTNAKGEQEYFEAVVLEVYDDSAVVEAIASDSENIKNIVPSGGSIIINTNTINELTRIELKEGDEIRIVYNMDSIRKDPLRIEIVYAIYMLDELDI